MPLPIRFLAEAQGQDERLRLGDLDVGRDARGLGRVLEAGRRDGARAEAEVAPVGVAQAAVEEGERVLDPRLLRLGHPLRPAGVFRAQRVEALEEGGGALLRRGQVGEGDPLDPPPLSLRQGRGEASRGGPAEEGAGRPASRGTRIPSSRRAARSAS